MKTWRFIWRLFLFKKWTLMLQVGTAVVAMVAIEHTVALVQREVFDTLTGDAATSVGVGMLCAILVGLALGHSVTYLGDEVLFRSTGSPWLRCFKGMPSTTSSNSRGTAPFQRPQGRP